MYILYCKKVFLTIQMVESKLSLTLSNVSNISGILKHTLFSLKVGTTYKNNNTVTNNTEHFKSITFSYN